MVATLVERRMLVGLMVAMCAAGCVPTHAVVNGQRAARLTLQYSDANYFRLVYAGVHPAAIHPSSGLWADGGRITGTVCGADLVYDVWHAGRIDSITGFITDLATPNINRPVKLVIQDGRSGRLIEGTVGNGHVEIHLSPERLEGTIQVGGGRRPYDFDRRFLLRPRGDDLVGLSAIGASPEREGWPVRVTGWSDVWAMPAAAQAALLPSMLTCHDTPVAIIAGGPTIATIDLRHQVAPPNVVLAPLPPLAAAADEHPPSQGEIDGARDEYDRLYIGFLTDDATTDRGWWKSAGFYQGRGRDQRRWLGAADLLEAVGEARRAEEYRKRSKVRLGLVVSTATTALLGIALTSAGWYVASEQGQSCRTRDRNNNCVDRWEGVGTGAKVTLGLGAALLGVTAVTGIVAGVLPNSRLELDEGIGLAEQHNARLRARLRARGSGRRFPFSLLPYASPTGAGLAAAGQF